jgi:FkbM family methyltransferase
VSRLFDDAKLYWHYGVRIPDNVILPNSASPIYLDRHESRGRALLIGHARGQAALKRIWHQANCKMRPDYVLDIGANYGEFMFGERYPSAKQVIGVEANPALRPWLEKSAKEHPDCDKIMFEFAIAAAASGQSHDFFVDPTWSGRSSAVRLDGLETVRVQVKSVCVDELFSTICLEGMSVLFKIDVEGYESFVISGMHRLLSESAHVFGFLEFNDELIARSGADPNQLLGVLGKRCTLAAIGDDGHFSILETPTLESLREILQSEKIETNLAVLSSPSMVTFLEE